MPFIKKMPAIEHFEVVLMFKTVKTPPTVKSPSPTLYINRGGIPCMDRCYKMWPVHARLRISTFSR